MTDAKGSAVTKEKPTGAAAFRVMKGYPYAVIANERGLCASCIHAKQSPDGSCFCDAPDIKIGTVDGGLRGATECSAYEERQIAIHAAT